MLVLTNAHARYTFTSRGGGLKSVELLDYPETISARWKKKATTAGVATLNTRAAVPVLAMLGDTNLIGDGNFTLIKIGDGVHAEKFLPNGLRIVKEFHIGSNYLVNATVRLENTSDQSLPLPAQEWVVGTATPMDVDDNNFPMYGGAMWFDGAKEQQSTCPISTPTPRFCFLPPHAENRISRGSSNVVWAAADNQFFTLLAMPKNAGRTNRRAPGFSAGVHQRRMDAGHAAAGGHPDGAGLSGANPRNQSGDRAADCSLCRARRNTGRWRASARNSKTMPTWR